MFTRKDLDKPTTERKSALSQQLETDLPTNPFREYAKFDSKVWLSNISQKNIGIVIKDWHMFTGTSEKNPN